MNYFAEITHRAFRAIVPVDVPCSEVRDCTDARIEFYQNNGVLCQVIRNHVSGTVQYYVKDINA